MSALPTAPVGRITEFTRDGLVFDVVDEGPIDGEVVVLLHGFPERASCWRLVAPLLHAQGYRTVAPDQRGYSPRARPTRRRDYRTAELADDVAALIDVLGGRVHLVGHDWGAIVGWAVVAAHADRVRSWTSLSIPHPRAYLRSLVRSTQGLKSWYMLAFQVPAVPELLAARPRGIFDRSLRGSGMSRDDVARFREEIVDYGAFPGGVAYYRGLPFTDRRQTAARVTVPTTLVWSDGDDFVGRAGVDGTAALVDADFELVVLAGVDHWIPTHAPEAAAEAILERMATS
ncbi:alpha/beta fold hydrolase [Nocardioides sp.]|uniref:alpha/beta fold hydrolase n=1 Tax=Nocardioides sp. TaxID=35761 RepID=UPI00271560ED|nr:alpha/beta fold hydrolase [Nocardioides sp.]MDO9457308.1 alpha/beta fold hydrolase [Nocardioides sp.]